METPVQETVTEAVPATESRKKKAFGLVFGVPLALLLGLGLWQGAGRIGGAGSEPLSLVQQAQAATLRVDDTLKAIGDLLGVESFTALSAEERAALIQRLGDEDRAELVGLMRELQAATQSAAELAALAVAVEAEAVQDEITDGEVATEASAESSEAASSGLVEFAVLVSDLDALLANADEALTALEEAAPEGSEIVAVAQEALASNVEGQAALDALLDDLAQKLVDSGMTQEEAAALTGAIGERMTNAWQNASEQGREGLMKALEAQTRRETAPQMGETKKAESTIHRPAPTQPPAPRGR